MDRAARSPQRSPALGVAVATLMACAIAHGASGDHGQIIDAMRERIFVALDLRPGMAVGEIGAGDGWFVVRVAEAIGSDGIIYATDIDPRAVEALRERTRSLKPASARVDARLCRDARDTALDDLPGGHLDLITMVDSLCFNAEESRERNVAYLRRLLRVLRPGGRLVHHMDCSCDVTPEQVIALFVEAGFAPRFETLDVPVDPSAAGESWPCRTDIQRRRHAWVGIFRKAARDTL